MSVDAESDSS